MTGRAHILMTASAVALASMMLSGGAAAQSLTIDQYRHPKTDKDLVFNKAYLTGVKDGLMSANISADDKMFCLTGEVPILSFEQANDVMLSWARKRGADANSISVNRALLYSLKEKYPCRGGPK